MDEQPPKATPRFYVTVTDAAALLGYTRQAILHLIKSNRLRAIRFGNDTGGRPAFYLIRRDDVRKYTLEKHLRRKIWGRPRGPRKAGASP